MFKNIPKEKILEVVKQGPTIPQKIVKMVGGDTMLVGAILSTMISTGEICYTVVKVGGSPIYYVPEDESKLEEFTNYLNEKDRKAVKMLKDEKVMQDSVQDPLTRVSLKTAKDFAKPFEVGYNNKKESFYRYFLVSKDEAELLASEILKKKEQILYEKMVEEKRLEEKKIKEIKDEQDITEKELLERKKIEEPISEKKTEVSSEKTRSKEHIDKPIHKHTHHTANTHQTKHVARSQNEVEHKSESNHSKKFLEIITEKVHEMGLDIISKEKIKKTEYTLILKNHTSNEYHYAVAKDKKTITEGDLSTAFVFAHNKRMPCVFFMTGKLSAKAEQMINKEFKDMQIICVLNS